MHLKGSKQDILTRAFSPGNSDAMDILTLGLGRVLGLELGRQDVPVLKNTGVNFLASGCRGPKRVMVNFQNSKFAPYIWIRLYSLSCHD